MKNRTHRGALRMKKQKNGDLREGVRLTHGKENKQGVSECVERMKGEKITHTRVGRAEVTRDRGKRKKACPHYNRSV